MATFTRGTYPSVRLVALLGAVLIAAGCGSGGALSLIDPVASAADKTLDKRSAHFDLTMRMEGSQSTAMSGQGSFDSAAQTMEMTMTVPQVGTIVTRMLFPVLYLQMHGVPGLSGEGWAKIDLQTAARTMGIDLRQLATAGNQTPSDALAQLRGASDAEKLGTQTIDGVETTHYRAKLDLDKALAKATAGERRALKALLRSATDRGYTFPASVDVWVGDDGLVRRLFEQLAGLGTMTMSFSDYGVPVKIQAPPASDTTDLGQLLNGGTG